MNNFKKTIENLLIETLKNKQSNMDMTDIEDLVSAIDMEHLKNKIYYFLSNKECCRELNINEICFIEKIKGKTYLHTLKETHIYKGCIEFYDFIKLGYFIASGSNIIVNTDLALKYDSSMYKVYFTDQVNGKSIAAPIVHRALDDFRRLLGKENDIGLNEAIYSPKRKMNPALN